MTVRDLITALSTLPDDTLVIVASDSEGNSYSPAGDPSPCRYIAETTCGGYIPHPDEYPDGQATGVAAVCLWPIA